MKDPAPNTLTEEEKDQLELDRANAKLRCKEVWRTIEELYKVLRTYNKIHRRWKKRYEKADHALAMDERKVYEIKEKGPIHSKETKLTKEQLQTLLAELGEEE